MQLHKQVHQGQAGLMCTSQYGNHIDGTVLLAYTRAPAVPHSFLTANLSRQLFRYIY